MKPKETQQKGVSENHVSVDIQNGTGNVVVAGTARVDGGIRSEVSVGTLRTVNFVEVRERISAVREVLQTADVASETREEATAELDTGLAQLRKKQPDKAVIKQALHNAAKILGAVANANLKFQLVERLSGILSLM